MRTVQLTLDEKLVEEVDALAAKLGTTRSALTRDALRDALARRRELELEKRHRDGYRRKPVGKKEFAPLKNHQVWPED